MSRYLKPYQWRLSLSLFALLSAPLLLVCAFVGMFLTGPLFDNWQISTWVTSLPPMYKFLFWWDTIFIITGITLFTCITLCFTFFFTRKHHLDRRRSAILSGVTYGVLLITTALLLQKTDNDALIYVGLVLATFLITSPFLSFIETKKERLIAFLVALFFGIASIGLVRLLIYWLSQASY